MAYEAYHNEQLQDYEDPVEKVEEATLAPERTQPRSTLGGECRCDALAEGAGDGVTDAGR